MSQTTPAPLHPRPRLRRDAWFDLCGQWQFAYDDADLGLEQRWQAKPELFDRVITVPFPPESELSGINDKGFHPVVWYRREISAPDLAGGRLLLHFGAVDYAAKVWVNGDLVASHEGGHTPFSADITPSLRPGDIQTIVVRAEDQPLDATQPRGKQDWQEQPHSIWYHRTTGIWQPVWLEPVPRDYLANVQFTPDLVRAMVGIEIRLGRKPVEAVECRIQLSRAGEPLGQQPPTLSEAHTLSSIHIAGFGHGQDRARLLWTPETPNLIDVSVALFDASGQPLDQVDSYFGMRSAAAAERRFLLNDKPYFMRSVLEQGYWPQSHLAAPSPDALKREVELIT